MTMASGRTNHSDTGLGGLVREGLRREPVFAGTALLLAILVPPTLLAMAVDTRTHLGINIWIKPLKFEIALVVYLATLTWFAGWLPAGTTRALWYRVFSGIVAACVLAEMAWIGGAAMAGIASHFNVSDPLMASLYGLMGVLAVILTSATLLYAVLIALNDDSDLGPVFRTAVVLGLALTFILTVLAGGTMASGSGHHVGGSGSDAGGLWPIGWARDGGDLRVAHFFATHAMHFIPAVGLVAGTAMSPRGGRLVVIAFAAAIAGLVAFTLIQALAGRPFV